MTGYDVHTDKALKELRARLDQAERERDEARGHARAAERDAVEAEARCAALTAERDEAVRAFRDLVAVLDRDGGQRQAGETIAGTLERAVRVAADAVVGADALREERDEARAALAASEGAHARTIEQRDAAWSELGAGPVGREDCGCVPCSGCVGLRAVGVDPVALGERAAAFVASLPARAPTAAERWRAVPAEAKDRIALRLESMRVKSSLYDRRDDAAAADALLALAREAEGT